MDNLNTDIIDNFIKNAVKTADADRARRLAKLITKLSDASAPKRSWESLNILENFLKSAKDTRRARRQHRLAKSLAKISSPDAVRGLVQELKTAQL